MDTMIESLPQFAAYQPSLGALTIFCFAVLIQSFLAAPLAFAKGEQTPGMPLQGDHSLLSFRVLRTYQNSVESLPAFGFALLLAILVGVNASLVNWLAGIHVVFRLAYWAAYYSGIGKVTGGPRTLCYVVCLITNMVLVGACLFAIFA